MQLKSNGSMRVRNRMKPRSKVRVIPSVKPKFVMRAKIGMKSIIECALNRGLYLPQTNIT